MAAIRVDLSPLSTRVGARDIGWYDRAAGVPFHRRFSVVFAAVVSLAVALGCALGWSAVATQPTVAAIVTVFIVFYAVFAAAAFLLYTLGVVRRVRIAEFAASNGFGYVDTVERTRRSGTAFTRVRRSREREVIACADPRLPFELGRHYSVPDESRRATVQRPFVFVELPLSAKVPHIVLKNRHHSVIPTLGLGRGAATMALEGHFASTFLLLVPEGYERDALYIFTPDVMEQVLNLVAGGEMELVEDRVYVYLPYRTRLDQVETMRRLIELIEELHRRFERQTTLYTDVAAGEIARRSGVAVGLRGLRLTGRGVSLTGIAATTGVLLLSAGITAAALYGDTLLGMLGPGP